MDVQRLADFLRGQLPDWPGDLDVTRMTGGQSNPTYELTAGSARYVLRKKPDGLLLGSAHAVDREYAVQAALHGHSTVPVARPRVLCTDESVIGTAFYVMDYVEGRVLWDPGLPEVSAGRRPDYFAALIDTLAAIHNFEYRAGGLMAFGRPDGYVQRQIRRWFGQYRLDEAAGRVPAIERLAEWLETHLPAKEEAALVHGDYRIDNVMFHPTEPRVVAVMDWELSTIGHPLADLGYHVMMYRMPTLAVTGLADVDLAACNLPDESAYVARYCAATHRDSVADLDYYVSFNLFRFAAILHGIRGRLLRGTAASKQARHYAGYVEAVAELGWNEACRARLAG